MESKVSICIPTYNRSDLLKRAVNSVLQQSYSNLELIISDNCSTENHWIENQKLQSVDNKIKLFRNNENIGWSNNLNKCIEYASGDLVLFLCDDDELLEDSIFKLVNFHIKYPKVGLVSGNGIYIDFKNHKYIHSRTLQAIITSGKNALEKILTNNNIFFSSVMIKKEIFNEVGFFLNVASCDWEMWARIGKKYDIGYINEPIVNFYSHEVSNRDPRIYVDEWVLICNKIISYFEYEDQYAYKIKGYNELANGILSLGLQSIAQRKWKNGFIYLKLGFRFINPIMWVFKILINSPKSIIKALIFKIKNLNKTSI